ncbi:MAG: hypothetical protein IIB90_12140 [Gemmatimonadetes bacterium]|nr:hypothetical protein [Gemmatimonadota bacterium]
MNCKIHYMWYRMPMGRDAVREAKAAAVRNRMAAIRCTARLIARIGTRELDRALGKAVCQQLAQVEEALEGREEPSPLSHLPTTPTPATLRFARTETPSP